MGKPDPARPYIRALYAKNHLRFAGTAVLGILLQLTNLFVSWVLGEVIDAISAGDAAALQRSLMQTLIFTAFTLAVGLAYYRLRSVFLRRAAAQYKDKAFETVSGKSISAFNKENTGRYIALLTSDAEKVQENYLAVDLWLIPQPFLLMGTLGMMFRLSPALTLATILLGLLSMAGSMLLAPELARREKALSDANEAFVGRIQDLLSGFALTSLVL